MVEHWKITAVWEREDGSERERTTATGTLTYRVGVSVADRHAPAQVPSNPLRVVHERGGPLDGANLRATPDRAIERLVRDRGGRDAVARKLVAGNLERRTVRLPGRRPANLTGWVYGDLARLREQVRNLSVNVSRAKLVTEMNADRKLADRFATRWTELVDAPEEYRSVADKVRVAARAAYLRAVQQRLERRVDAAAETREGLNRSLTERTSFSAAEVGRLATGAASVLGSNGGEQTAERGLTVDAAPTYLTLEPVTGERVPAVRGGEFRPLVARNVNLFAVPYGDASDTVLGGLFDGDGGQTSFRTAATTLHRAEAVAGAVDNGTLDARRTALRSAVGTRLALIERRLGTRVARTTRLTRSEAATAVEAGLGRWERTGARATAVVNGSAAPVIVAAVDRRHSLSRRARDELAVRLRIGLQESHTASGIGPGGPLSSRVPEGVVDETATTTRRVARGELKRLVDEETTTGLERAQEEYTERLGAERLFAGLPLAPPVTPWYATANVWHVSVRGEYARFTVHSRSGGPGETLTYSRDGRPVTTDVDGDGDPERLGRADRLSFAQDTVIVIAVPPGGYGVGERDGNAHEVSEGWPTAGATNGSAAPNVAGRHAQDGRPARSWHVPRAADVRAGLRRRTPGGVRGGSRGGRRVGRGRDGSRANGDRRRAPGAGGGGRGPGAVGRGGGRGAGAVDEPRRRDGGRDGLRPPLARDVDRRAGRGPAGGRRRPRSRPEGDPAETRAPGADDVRGVHRPPAVRRRRAVVSRREQLAGGLNRALG